jgi:zinc/manganese transport system substrate-binding protein
MWRGWPWLVCLLVLALPAQAQQRLSVVASFSVLDDLVRNVGGDRVSVVSLVGPGADAHVYSPSPGDARKVAGAKLVIINGLGLEGWLPRLVQSAGDKASIVVASTGVTPLKRGSFADPHAWQSVSNAKIYVANIREASAAADAAEAAAYRANAERYLAELDALDAEVRAAVATIPPERRKVITTHGAFGYFAEAYGMAFIAPLGVSTETEPSARDIAEIIGQIKQGKIPAVFLENLSDDRLIGRIAAESGAKIGGTLYSDALTDEKGDAPTYIAMVKHNIRALTNALDR